MPLLDCLANVADEARIKKYQDRVQQLTDSGKHIAEAETIAKHEFVNEEYEKLHNDLNDLKKSIGGKVSKFKKTTTPDFAEANKNFESRKQEIAKEQQPITETKPVESVPSEETNIPSQIKTTQNAITEGEQPKGNIPQHRGGESSGQATETSSSNRAIEGGEIEQGQKEIGGGQQPPIQPPKETTLFSPLSQKERVRGAYEHLMNSDIPADMKEQMKKEGIAPNGSSIKYKVAGNEQAQKAGKAIIQSFGADESLALARQGTFHPSVNSAVFAEAINHFQELEANAKTPQEKLQYAQQWADTFDEYATLLTGAGQFSQYAYQYYKTSKLGFVISAERKFNARREEFTTKAEKTLKEIIHDIENEPEFQEYIKGRVADEYFKNKDVKNKVVTKLNDTAAKIRKEGIASILPDWLKADIDPDTKQSSIAGKALDEIIAKSLEGIAKGIEAGEKIADLVKDAVKNIKAGGTTASDKDISDWLYGQFKSDKKDSQEQYRESLRNQIKELDDQIAKGIKKDAEKNEKEYDAETQALIDERDAKRKKVDEIGYQKNLKEQIKSLDDQIKKRQRVKKEEKSMPQYSDETKALIKERDDKRKDLNKVAPLEKTAKQILDKWDKKLSNLNPEKRKELLGKVVHEITESGGLNLDTFKQMYADALGLPSMTPEMKAKLLDLGGKLNGVDKAREALEKNPTDENIAAFQKAMTEGETASRELNELFGERGITLDRFLNIAKLNTLGVANLIMNPMYNIGFMPVRFAESLLKTGMDYMLKAAGFARGKDGVYENVFYKQLGYYKGFGTGGKRAIRGIIEGQTSFDYFQKQQRQNIRPLESFKDIIAHYKGEKPLTKSELANAMMETLPTMGLSAEIIARGLQVGDLPFRDAAEYAMAENIARQRGLSGVQKQAFILNPDEASKKIISEAGARSVMQQDNALTDLIKRLSFAFKYVGQEKAGAKIVSGIGKVIGATTQPFVKIPLNSAMTVLELAVPEFSAAKGIFHAIRGERDAALNAFSRAAVGIAMGAAYSQIAQAGLITSTSSNEDKINASIAKEDVYGGNHINFTAFKRWLTGGSAEWQDNDTFLNLNAFGLTGSIMAMYGAKYDKMSPEEWQKMSYLSGLSDRVSSSFIEGLKNNVFGNTSTLLNVMSDGNMYNTNKWLRSSSNVLLNAIEPSFLTQGFKLKNDFKVDYTAMDTKDQLLSTLKERVGFKEDLPSQVTVWGEKRSMTPKGANPILYYYADITKHRNLDTRDFGYNVMSLYNKTKEDAVIPSRPQKTIRKDNQSFHLDATQYEELQILVGKQRKVLAQATMNGRNRDTDGRYKSWDDLTDEGKVNALKESYKSGYEIGKNQFLIIHPNFFNQETENK